MSALSNIKYKSAVDILFLRQIYFLIDHHCKTSIRNLQNPRKYQIRLMFLQGVVVFMCVCERRVGAFMINLLLSLRTECWYITRSIGTVIFCYVWLQGTTIPPYLLIVGTGCSTSTNTTLCTSGMFTQCDCDGDFFIVSERPYEIQCKCSHGAIVTTASQLTSGINRFCFIYCNCDCGAK